MPGTKVRIVKCANADWVGKEVVVQEPNPKFTKAIDPEVFASLKVEGAICGFYLPWKNTETV